VGYANGKGETVAVAATSCGRALAYAMEHCGWPVSDPDPRTGFTVLRPVSGRVLADELGQLRKAGAL